MELLLLLLPILLFLVCYFVKKRYNYWAARGVPSLTPQFPFGNVQGVGKSITIEQRMKQLYLELKGRCVVGGTYVFLSPEVLILDLDLLRNVLVKDFRFFENRGVVSNVGKDPLSGHLFSLEGEAWRKMRAKLSVAFTSAKMRNLHSTLLLVADQFKDHLRPMAEKCAEVEMTRLFARFTTDVIGNVAFGIECNSMKDPDNEFMRMGSEIFAKSRYRSLRRLVIQEFPGLVKLFNLRIIPKYIGDFFLRTVQETVEYREKNNLRRNDFLQLLMELKNSGTVDGGIENANGRLSIEEVAAQTFLFFAAGFHSSSSIMTFAVYELAMNETLQERTRKEIRQVLERHTGELSYEAAMEMRYLDQVIYETLRKYPIGSILRRRVEKTYKIANSDIVLEKGTRVVVSVMGIHHDPEIYPEPEIFDPERFSKEKIATRHPYAWLPFGEGPRNCIGMRFGIMQTRIGLATILSNFRLIPTETTPTRVEFSPNSNVLGTVGGMNLRIGVL